MSKDGLSITEMEEGGGSKRSQKAASLPLVVTISKEATENAAILNTISKVGCDGYKGQEPLPSLTRYAT